MGRATLPIQIPMPADGDFGPAMQALNPNHRAFVIALLMNRGNAARAAQLAGYAGNSDTIKVQGYRIAHRDDVQLAIQEEARRRINASAIQATETLVELLNDGDPKIRLKAAQQVLASTGLGAIFKHEHQHTVENKTQRELLDYIKLAAAEQGLDPRKLLGRAGVTDDVLDAEFAEVIIPSSEGLEDLL